MEPHNLDYVLSKLENRPTPQPDGMSASEYAGSLYSQRSLLQSYGKRRCQWNGYCKAFVIIVILLLIAWGVAVPLYFTVGPGQYSDVFGGDRKASAQKAPGVVAEVSTSDWKGKVRTAVNCSMRIVNHKFSPALDNIYSAEYQNLKRKLETLLSVTFHNDKTFERAVVRDFHPGSVVTHFLLMFTAPRPDMRSYARNVLTNHVMRHWTMLGNYQIELNSIDVQYIVDACAVGSTSCSHMCMWTLLKPGYECHCPQAYSLMADAKTCRPHVGAKATASPTPSLCGAGQHACRQGNCIPVAWLCDGVNDCLLGDDEGTALCRKRRVLPGGVAPTGVAGPKPGTEAIPTPQALQQKQQPHYLKQQVVISMPEVSYKVPNKHRKMAPLTRKPTVRTTRTTTSTTTQTPSTTPYIIWLQDTPSEDFNIPGLEEEMNGSQGGHRGQVKMPKLSHRFKFFG